MADPLTVIRVNGSYKNKIIRKFFFIPVPTQDTGSNLVQQPSMICNHDDKNSRGALMFNHMVAEMPTLDQIHKSAHDGAQTNAHPIWRQELLPLDLSHLMACVL